MAKDGAEALYFAVKSLIYAIQTAELEGQQNAAQRIVRSLKP